MSAGRAGIVTIQPCASTPNGAARARRGRLGAPRRAAPPRRLVARHRGVRPDRRGLAGARAGRSSAAGATRPAPAARGEGLLVDHRGRARARALAWHDIEQRFDAELRARARRRTGTTRATLAIDGPVAAHRGQGLRPLPRQALARLHALCQTAATL